jgi:putative membrane protein
MHYIWHLPSLYMLALESPSVHIAEHLSFVTAGMLFWLPIIEPVPGLVKMRSLAKLAYLAMGQIGTIPLVAILIWSPALIYPFYAFQSTPWNIPHMFDQQLAGILMMTIDMLVALTAAGWIVLKALAFSEWQHERYRSLHTPPTAVE